MSAESQKALDGDTQAPGIFKIPGISTIPITYDEGPSSDTISLEVGEKRFKTFRSTLTGECPYFAALLSSQWQQTQLDGSYFVDADGHLFVHILRFLRSGTLPLFYSSGTGHDYSMYTALLGEAQYFQIARLTDWLRKKEYEQAVKIRYSFEVDSGQYWRTIDSNEEMEYQTSCTKQKTYVCPRNVRSHRGDPSACGQACMKAKGNAADKFEDEEDWKVAIVKKKTTFSTEMCVPAANVFRNDSVDPWIA